MGTEGNLVPEKSRTRRRKMLSPPHQMGTEGIYVPEGSRTIRERGGQAPVRKHNIYKEETGAKRRPGNRTRQGAWNKKI